MGPKTPPVWVTVMCNIFAFSVGFTAVKKECFGVHGVVVHLFRFCLFEVVLSVGLDEVDSCGVSEKLTVDFSRGTATRTWGLGG